MLDLIILNAEYSAVTLLLEHFHEKLFLGSQETTVNGLGQKFWIVGLRTVLRNIINSCTSCRLLRVEPLNPQMADLPSSRLAHRLRPFTYCGLDYFGSMNVRVGRRTENRWGAIW